MILLQRFVFSGLFVLAAVAALAQTQVVEVDTSEVRRSALHLTFDYGKWLERIITDQQKWEIGAGFLIKDRYNITAEYGQAKLLPQNVVNNGDYEATGSYWRAGFDYFMKPTLRAYLSVGLLYARSSFDDQVTVKISSEIWENLDETYNRNGLSAQWLEFVLNSEGPIFKKDKGFLSTLYWGTKLRVRFFISETATDRFEIYAVPGYGTRNSPILLAGNLFLKFRFPL